VAKRKKRLKIGLALGGGSAKGFAHIGVLKVLHKNKIFPDYIAGTSAGAMVGALYAAGHSPEDIEEIAKKTDWKRVMDFTIPKSGFIEGKLIENKIRREVNGKKFSQLNIPFRAVAYNLDLHEKVVFSKGDVAKAVRASLSIPGIFAPLKIDGHRYIDGGVVDPTPFDVVKKMGADYVIAVDLLHNDKRIITGPVVKETSFVSDLREQFISTELINIKNYIIPTRWPKFIKWFIKWLFDKLLYPAKVLRIMTGKELPPIIKIMDDTLGSLINNLARERLDHANIDLKITPNFGNLKWSNMKQMDKFIELGEKETKKKLCEIKKICNF
jgi:predicted acylesterase/phospholipase RssA